MPILSIKIKSIKQTTIWKIKSVELLEAKLFYSTTLLTHLKRHNYSENGSIYCTFAVNLSAKICVYIWTATIWSKLRLILLPKILPGNVYLLVLFQNVESIPHYGIYIVRLKTSQNYQVVGNLIYRYNYHD